MLVKEKIHDRIDRIRGVPLPHAEDCIAVVKKAVGEEVSLRVVNEGWNNIVVIAENSLVFRFPRSWLSAGALRHETRFLGRFAPLAAIAVPQYEIHRDKAYRFPFARARYLSGQPLTSEKFRACSPDVQKAIAREFGKFLSALHGFPSAEARELGIGGKLGDEQQEYRTAKRILYPLFKPSEKAWVEKLRLFSKGYFRNVTITPRVVHSDLKQEHILIDGQGKLSIIDFGDIHLDDPAVDFASLLYYGEGFAREALHAYTLPHNKEFERRMHYYERSQAIIVPTYLIARGVRGEKLKKVLKKTSAYISAHPPEF